MHKENCSRTDLTELAILGVLLSVQEPVRNVELARVGHDGLDLLDLLLAQLTSAVKRDRRHPNAK